MRGDRPGRRDEFVPARALGGGAAACSGKLASTVAYDEELAERVRKRVAGEPALTEKKMFGGLAFLVGGNMAVAVSHRGGLMVRADPARSDELVATTNARTIEMRGRPMPGWLHVSASDVGAEQELAHWVDVGVGYARTLPAKPRGRSVSP